MRAVLVREPGPPSVLELADVDPPGPGPDEVSIDVAYAGVGFVDTLFRAGAFDLPLPFVPGIEATGTVRAVGDGVDDLVPGQTVAALLNDFGRGPRGGGYAEVVVAHRSMTVPVPDPADLPRVTAALVNGVTAWIALRDLARTTPDETVVVLGASGGLGGTSARLAALLPARRVVGVVGRDRSRAPASCTDVVLNEEFAGWAAQHHPDVVLDPVGGDLRAAAFGNLAPFGRLVVLGNASGEDPPLTGDTAWHATATLTGLSLGGVAHLQPDVVRTALRAVVDLVARGLLDEPAPVVRGLADAVAVHQAFDDLTAPPKTVLAIR